jgi:phospholipase/carboxylesterase
MRQPNLPQNAGLVEWIGPDHPLYEPGDLIHCVRLPEAASLENLAPAVVMLHGWGGDECAMWLFQQVIPKIAAVITPRAPLELGSNSFMWFNYRNSRQQPDGDSLQASLGKLRHFLGALPDVYPIDLDRLVLMGFSQGAAMSHTLVLTATQPELAGLASLAGFIPDLPELAEPATMLTGLPVFITHGSRDEIVPVERARQTRDRYQRLGAEITYSEHTTGHKVHREAMKALKKWLRDILCDQIGGTNDERCNPS